MTGELIKPRGPAWWDLTRRVVIFALGTACILVALFAADHPIGLLTIGLVLAGILPIENWLQIRR